MKRSFAKYTTASILCVGFLVTGTAALAQTQAPSFEPGPGPTSSRPDTTGTPGSMSSPSGKSAKQQMKECVTRTRAANTSISESAAKETCQQAMKAQKDSSHQEKPQ
jgi:hypothetical protein